MGGYPGLLPRGVFGTSPVREVGFGELVLSTAPISRGSWWRSASEVAELWNSWQNCWSEISLGPDACLVALVLFQRNSGE